MTGQAIRQLGELLARRIPLTGFMDVRPGDYDGVSLTLHAPLAPNVNHKGTAFGGSLAALATVTGWAMVELKLIEADVDADLVVYRSDMRYLQPVTQDLVARCRVPEAAELERFMRDLRERGRASVEVIVEILQNERAALIYSGEYLARVPAS